MGTPKLCPSGHPPRWLSAFPGWEQVETTGESEGMDLDPRQWGCCREESVLSWETEAQ